MRKVKIGIIGCGVICHIYINNIKSMYEWLEIVACADRVLPKAQEVAEKYDLPKACSVEELLADSAIEMVINLTIPIAHTEINQKVLRSGKHVYCEKPLALTLQDAKETIELAKSKGLMLGCAPETFMGAGPQTCRKIIDEGWIGKPVSATANMTSYGVETWHASPEFYYKEGAGPMMDMGPYYLTALVHLLGPIEKLGCFASIGTAQRKIFSQPLKGKTIDVEVSTTYTGMIAFESGVQANINMSFDIWHSNLPKLEIYGTEGTLIIPDPNMFGGEIKIFRKEKVLDAIQSQIFSGKEPSSSIKYENLQVVPQIYQQPFENMRGMGILDMAFALVNGRKHRANEELAFHVTEALLGFDQSAKNGTLYQMVSTCSRPMPLPQGFELGELD